jgi:hypothetical protein
MEYSVHPRANYGIANDKLPGAGALDIRLRLST